jgi:uncharacterized protein (TIGR03067 family)
MLKTAVACVALCGLAVLAGRGDDPDPEPPGGANAELKKLKGTWTVTKAILGKRELKVARPGLTFTFDGDKLTRATPFGKLKGNVKGKGNRTLEYKVKIDTKKKPHTIELIGEGAKSGPVGIYKIEKGELFLAHPLTKDGKGVRVAVVPKDFSGDDAPVYVMTREKDKK